LIFKTKTLSLSSVTPAGSPKNTYRRSVSEEHQPKDIVTLSAVNQAECSCGVKEKIKEGSMKSSLSPDEDFFQHAPTSCIHKSNEKE
jgi:hypothetical protein